MKYLFSLFLTISFVISIAFAVSLQFKYVKNDQCYLINIRSKPNYHSIIKHVETCEGEFADPYIIDEYFINKPKQPLKCPDNETQVVAFCPNMYPVEQKVTKRVYDEAVSLGFKSVLLSVDNATKTNFLNYASCPKLVALFYDGDGDPSAITAVDDLIYYTDISRLNWNYQVTSYWLACNTYNSPMLDSVTVINPRKWTAGISSLWVGSSDDAASSAMIAALHGKCLTESFDHYVTKYDSNTSDVWGFGGFGPNVLSNYDVVQRLPCSGLE